jgi:hypothetical protein
LHTTILRSHTSPIMVPRPFHRCILSRISSISHRSFHNASAQFVTTDAQGFLKECTVPISHGDPHEAYVLVPPSVGNAFSAACVHPETSQPESGADILPLTFDHQTKSFTCSKFSSRLMASKVHLTNSVYSLDSAAAAYDPSRPSFQVQYSD